MPSVIVGDSCPASYRPLDRKPKPTSTEPIVPAGISAATLCTYDVQSQVLTGSGPLPTGRGAALAQHLNSLDNWRKTSNEADGCLLGDAAAYQILLQYDGRSNLLVTLDCGVAVRDGVVRRLDDMKTVLGYWPGA